MGIGKSGPPPTPDYTQSAIATANSNKYNSVSPYGSSSWSLRPGADPKNPQPGDYIQTSVLSPQEQGIYDQNAQGRLGAGLAAGTQAQELAGGNQAFQDALYGKETQYYDQRFGQDQNALESKLTNQGVTPGSEAWNQSLQQFNQNKNQAYSTATMDSITGADQAQNNAVMRLSQLLSAGRPNTPQGGQGGGADLSGAASQQYQSALGNVNAQNAMIGQGVSQVGQLGTMAMLAYLLG